MDEQTQITLNTIEHFNQIFNRHDVDAVIAAFTYDYVFENTSPSPDGERYEGQAAVRGFWQAFFNSNLNAAFETEDLFAANDRCTVRWVYRWVGANGVAGHVRGVDVFRVRDGKVAEKCSYVKG